MYNGVRIFPALYAMNFLPSKSVRRDNFFPEITDPPTPASKVNWSSPKLERLRGKLCLYFVLSSFLHMLVGRLLGKKKNYCSSLFFSARYVFLVIQYF